jgi:segregation and condensation protein B
VTDERERQERAPIAWEALAAELAGAREQAAERGQDLGDDDPAAWDAVAAQLAARVAERPAPVEEPPPLVVVPPLVEPPPREARSAHSAAPGPEADECADLAEEPVVELDDQALLGGLEALLFVMDDPVDAETLAGALHCPPEQAARGLTALAASYDERRAGITLRQVGEGWRLYTREEHAAVVERYLVDGARSRLTQAALETLAVIAYRQPVTRARVSAIRGVGVDGVMRTLLARGLVQEVGTDPDSGGGLYATTELFLERLGLSGLEELPELAPLLPEAAAVLDEHPDA